MAQRVQYLLVCDLHDDDTDGDETLSFALDGTRYEIDVCEDHAAEIRDAFAPYVGAARRAGGRAAAGRGSRSSRSSRRGRRSSSGGRSADIRAWARSQGIQVSERGRIPANVIDQYNASH